MLQRPYIGNLGFGGFMKQSMPWSMVRDVRNIQIIFLLTILLSHGGWASPFPDINPSDVERIFVTTDDGATEELIHLRNPGKPLMLLEPGLGAQGLSLELPATALRLRGDFDVFIGNWRGSTKLPENMNPFGPRNGLTEVMRLDLPAHLRYILNHYATEEQRTKGITFLGNSMGGMMIMGMLSDPSLYAEFRPLLRSIVLFQSPHHVRYVQYHLKLAARLGLPLLKSLKAVGVTSINTHSRLLEATFESKNSNGIQGRLLTPAAENIVLALTRLVMNPSYTGRKDFRRFFFKTGAYSVPIDLIEDFANAVINQGHFNDASGNALIKPQNIIDIPIQVVRTRLDTLAPWLEQAEYFAKLKTNAKQLVDVQHLSHADTVMVRDEPFEYFDHVLNFVANPHEEASQRQHIIASKPCASLLERFRNRF